MINDKTVNALTNGTSRPAKQLLPRNAISITYSW